MKDFYDVLKLMQQFSFQGEVLCESLNKTLLNRNTDIIEFDELVDELTTNKNLDIQWTAFLQKSALKSPEHFADALSTIGVFLNPILSAIKNNTVYQDHWTVSDGWIKKSG